MSAARYPKQMRVVKSGVAKAEVLQDRMLSAQQVADQLRRRVVLVKPCGFARVPTHAVGVWNDRRVCPRAALGLPLRLIRVADREESVPVTLVTKNISSSGVFFLCPRWIAPGTPIELEVGLVERPLGRGSVRMTTGAHVVRIEPTETPGWHGMAARFDDLDFRRDEPSPPRFQMF